MWSTLFRANQSNLICIPIVFHLIKLFVIVITQVAVHNLGQGTVNLLDLDEEYIATFPSGFGRSILTVPWVELGGKVSIQATTSERTSQLLLKPNRVHLKQPARGLGMSPLVQL